MLISQLPHSHWWLSDPLRSVMTEIHRCRADRSNLQHNGDDTGSHAAVVYRMVIRGTSQPLFLPELSAMSRWSYFPRYGRSERATSRYLGHIFKTNRGGLFWKRNCTRTRQAEINDLAVVLFIIIVNIRGQNPIFRPWHRYFTYTPDVKCENNWVKMRWIGIVNNTHEFVLGNSFQ